MGQNAALGQRAAGPAMTDTAYTAIGAGGGGVQQPGPSVSPANITQSFYTSPSDATNYDQNRPVYSQSDAVRQAAEYLAQLEGNRPGAYTSAYGDQIQQMLNNLLNRDKFNYDFATDPMYQQYAEKYQQQGKMAMRDTMGQAAALTGGYGNSYAQTAGQQTYQSYLQNLNDMIPELRNAAYQAYMNEGDTMRANLGMLQTQDATDYGRYRDTVSDYRDDLNYHYNRFSDMSAAEYNRYQNDSAAWAADRDYWYRRHQDQQAQSNWEREFALALAQANRRGGGGGRSSASAPNTNAANAGSGSGWWGPMNNAVGQNGPGSGSASAAAAAAAGNMLSQRRRTGGGGSRATRVPW